MLDFFVKVWGVSYIAYTVCQILAYYFSWAIVCGIYRHAWLVDDSRFYIQEIVLHVESPGPTLSGKNFGTTEKKKHFIKGIHAKFSHIHACAKKY